MEANQRRVKEEMMNMAIGFALGFFMASIIAGFYIAVLQWAWNGHDPEVNSCQESLKAKNAAGCRKTSGRI